MSNFENVKKFMEAFGQRVETKPQFPNEKTTQLRLDLIKGDGAGFDHSRIIMVNRQKVGAMGRISKTWKDSMDLDLNTVFGFEVDLEPIKPMINKKKIFKAINPYPKITRDLNLVMPVEQEVGDLLELFSKKGKKLVTNTKPVDIFVDEMQNSSGY